MRNILFITLLSNIFLLGYAQNRIDPKKIQIVRDSFGVPHIFAETDAEVAYGLAWANAEDDFESVQSLILPAKGKMGKVLGKKGAAGDYAFALFRCMEITEERWLTLSPAYLKVLQGYVQGINQYAKTHPKEIIAKGIFPVTEKEFIATSVLALTIFNGAGNAMESIFNNKAPTAPELNKKGSNSIAIQSSKSATNENYLVINAHQPNTGTQAFYEAHVCSNEGWNAMGGLLAGGTSILHGVNENLGWAHTVNFCDRLDVFQLEMHPEKKLTYKFDSEWIPLEKKTIKLQIKGIPIKIKREVLWSKYGATMKNKKGFFSIRLGANMRIGALDQWYQMNKASSFTEFYTAISKQELSMFNIMYADNRDTIFYINNALMPVRNPSSAYNWKATLPGNSSGTLWTEFRTIKELPQYINPSAGFLFNTNHTSFSATAKTNNLNPELFSKTDGWETWQNNRSMRFLEQLPVENPLDFEALKKIKFDMQLPQKLTYPFNIDMLFTMDEQEFPMYKDLIQTLKQWDKKGDANSKGAAIFLLAYKNLDQKLKGQASRAITKQEAQETLAYVQQYMVRYFGKTGITLGDLQKLVRGKKEWGLGGFPDLLSPQWTEPHKNGTLKSIGGDGLIMFIKFPKNSLPVIETVNMFGASSHPDSKHFDDQVPLYLNQQTKKMSLDKQTVLKNAEKIYYPGQY